MKTIHAIYERGVFRPLETVDLPETTEVVFEPRPVLPPAPPEARAKVLAAMAQRFDSGENDVASKRGKTRRGLKAAAYPPLEGLSPDLSVGTRERVHTSMRKRHAADR